MRTTNINELVGLGAGAILVDAPVGFKTWSEKGKGRSAERHYQTWTWDELRALDVAALAAPDCVLFIWICWPHLPRYLELIEAWGFTYKTCAFSWTKADIAQLDMFRDDADVQIGNGYWTRSNTEPCLLATRGKPKRLATGTRVRQAIIEPRREHSRKPCCIQERIERLVAGPYVELFARESSRPGWTFWGNETDKFGGGRALYDPIDDINKSVGEGFSVLRARVAAAGSWERQRQDGYPDLPDFLRRGGQS